MNDFSVLMAITDYVPVVFFTVAAVYLQRDLYEKMSKGAFALFAAGTIDIVFAGALKATYKLLYALGICNFETLSELFFPLQAIGFLLAGIGIVAMTYFDQGTKSIVYSVATPVLFRGTFLFVTLMVLGLAGMNIGLCRISRKMKKWSAFYCFIIAFVFSLCMGYLSSRDFSQAFMNWVAQVVNIIGQGAMLCGVIVLHRAGMKGVLVGEEKI